MIQLPMPTLSGLTHSAGCMKSTHLSTTTSVRTRARRYILRNVSTSTEDSESTSRCSPLSIIVPLTFTIASFRKSSSRHPTRMKALLHHLYLGLSVQRTNISNSCVFRRQRRLWDTSAG